jgi:hypothetical protein
MRLDHTATGVSPPAASIDYLDREVLRTDIAA